MHPNNQIQAGYIILTEGSCKPPYRIAVNPELISAIEAHSGWSGCSSQVYVQGRNARYDTIETFDEILQLIDDYNKQHKTNSNYD